MFIELTDRNIDKKFILNKNSIVDVVPTTSHPVIRTTDGDVFNVSESYEEVKAKLLNIHSENVIL